MKNRTLLTIQDYLNNQLKGKILLRGTEELEILGINYIAGWEYYHEDGYGDSGVELHLSVLRNGKRESIESSFRDNIYE